MKKTIILLSFLLVSILGYSQNQALYGVRAGYNISDLNFEENSFVDMPNHTHRNGFAIGFFGEYGFSEKFSLFVELQYSAEGSKEKYDQIAQESGYNPESLRVDALQLPIMGKVKLTDKLSVAVGPQIGLKIYAYEDNYTNIHLSAVGGLEYMVTDVFFVDLRYSHGFTNIFDKEVGIKATNENIQIGVGFKL